MNDRELLLKCANDSGIEVFFDDDGYCYRVKFTES
jgi:hypothetical protein